MLGGLETASPLFIDETHGAFTASDYLCIWVRTPADGHSSADLTCVLQVAQSIGEIMNENKVMIKTRVAMMLDNITV